MFFVADLDLEIDECFGKNISEMRKEKITSGGSNFDFSCKGRGNLLRELSFKTLILMRHPDYL